MPLPTDPKALSRTVVTSRSGLPCHTHIGDIVNAATIIGNTKPNDCNIKMPLNVALDSVVSILLVIVKPANKIDPK
jgi:hypothetical protein